MFIFRRPRVAGVLLLGMAASLGGCEDLFSPSTARNYDELVNRMLGAVKNRTPEDAALNLFNVTSPDERRDAIAYLETKSWGHEAPYMRAYEILTTDQYPMVRAQAMRALGSSGQAGAGKFLAKGLEDKEVQVRRDAAWGLITTWDESATVGLILHSHPQRDLTVTPPDGEPDAQVRVFAVRALAHANTAEAVRALIDAMADKDAAVVRYAQYSLVAATGQNFSFDRKAWLTWYQETHVSATGPAASGPAATSPGIAPQ